MKGGWFYDVVTQGYRYHMSNINAAIGLVQLGKFEKMNRRKIEVAKQYHAAFENVENVTLLKNDGDREIGLFVYILRRKSRRNELMDFLGKQGVASGIHYIPNLCLLILPERRHSSPGNLNIFTVRF